MSRKLVHLDKPRPRNHSPCSPVTLSEAPPGCVSIVDRWREVEVEPFCGRLSTQAKSRAKPRELRRAPTECPLPCRTREFSRHRLMSRSSSASFAVKVVSNFGDVWQFWHFWQLTRPLAHVPMVFGFCGTGTLACAVGTRQVSCARLSAVQQDALHPTIIFERARGSRTRVCEGRRAKGESKR